MGDIEAVNVVHRILDQKDTALRVAYQLIADHERTIVAQRAELEALQARVAELEQQLEEAGEWIAAEIERQVGDIGDWMRNRRGSKGRDSC